MTEQEKRQQQEIEYLQKKLRSLTEAYHHTAAELKRMKKEEKEGCGKRGRPALDAKTKARILTLCEQGHTMREIAGKTGTALGTVHKVITKAAQEARRVYVYLDREEPATIIDVCSLTHKVSIVNFTDDMLSRAFGIKEKPDWKDFEEFLESRCMPRTRYGIREELSYMGLDVYDPFQIVEETKGRVYGDGQRLERMEPDWIEKYDRIRKEVKEETEQKSRLKGLMRQVSNITVSTGHEFGNVLW